MLRKEIKWNIYNAQLKPYLYVEYKKVKPIKAESRMMFAKGWEVENMRRCCLKGTKFQLGKMNKFWRHTVGHSMYR